MKTWKWWRQHNTEWSWYNQRCLYVYTILMVILSPVLQAIAIGNRWAVAICLDQLSNSSSKNRYAMLYWARGSLKRKRATVISWLPQNKRSSVFHFVYCSLDDVGYFSEQWGLALLTCAGLGCLISCLGRYTYTYTLLAARAISDFRCTLPVLQGLSPRIGRHSVLVLRAV